jgi:hypothetical protein
MTLMTLLIRDVWRICFPERMFFAPIRGAHYFFVFVLLLITGSFVAAAAPPQHSQDLNANPAPAHPVQQPSTAASNPSPHTSNEATPLQKAVHQKKVITEDDLAKPAKIISLSDLEGEENNPTCDLSCEAELRAQMGFGPEREAEFRNQLTLARHEIGDDRVWSTTLQDALQAASGYCDIKRQIEKIVGKGVVSEYIRNDIHSRFADREGKLISQYRNSAGLLTQRIEAIQRFAPFRATVMQYQWTEATARVCPDYTLP